MPQLRLNKRSNITLRSSSKQEKAYDIITLRILHGYN